MSKKYLIVSVSLLVINAVIIVFAGLPKAQAILKGHNDMYLERAKLEQQKQQKSDTAKISKQYKQLKEDAANLSGVFLQNEPNTILSFVDQLESKAEELSIEHQISISKIPEQKDSGDQSSSISFTLKGTYQNIYAYLAYIESLHIYMPFTSINLTKGEGSNIMATLETNIYWL
jgi:hypothetical protein